MKLILGLIMMAAFVGIMIPYIKNSKRWHFGAAFFCLLLVAGATATPPTPAEIAAQKANAEANAKAEKAQAELAAKQAKDDANKAEQARLQESPAMPEPTPTNPDYSDPGKQAAWIRVSEDAIRAKLKDPDSAEFRNVNFYAGGGVPMACGEVNAKNGFGGYTGFEPFVAAGSELAFLSSEMTSSREFRKVWNQFCKN
jgi:hypothetical protein